MTQNRKRFVRIFIVIAVMLTMHILVNNFDLFGALQAMHGG
mgnify:CR=1 FL=1